MEHENFWGTFDEQENKEETVILALRSGRELKVKIKNIGNVDDDNAEIVPEGRKDGYLLLAVNSVEYIDFIEYKS